MELYRAVIMESAYLAELMFVLLLHWGSQGHTQSYLSISVAVVFSVERGLDSLIDKQKHVVEQSALLPGFIKFHKEVMKSFI